MNLDETSVCFAPEVKSGLVVTRSLRVARALVKKQDTRTNVTYVATVCDDDSMQAYMPQFIIGNEAKITQQDLRVLRDAPAQGVHIVRNKQKAWNNHILMQEILRKLHAAVSHREDLQLVLVLDVAPCHIHKDVMQKAKLLASGLSLFHRKLRPLYSRWTRMDLLDSKPGCVSNTHFYAASHMRGW